MSDEGDRKRTERALQWARQFGSIDGAHHKAWVIDQMVRALLGSQTGEQTREYAAWLEKQCAGEDGPDTYEWDFGVAP